MTAAADASGWTPRPRPARAPGAAEPDAAGPAAAGPALVPAPVRVTSRARGTAVWERVHVVLDPALAGALPLLADLVVRRLGRRLTVADRPGCAAPAPSPGGPARPAPLPANGTASPVRPSADGTAPPAPPSADQPPPGALVVTLTHDPALAPEHHVLDVGPAGVEVRAAGADGARHAVQTLRQLVGPAAFRDAPLDASALPLPGVRVEDGPRFSHRGVLLDVARHFLPKREVLRFVELAAAHKLNVLHLHLTDDQGWRFEVRAFPRLTEVGGWRRESQLGSSRSPLFDGRPHGGWYTQDDLREIVAFARTRGVTVVPELDVPGHSQAAMAAYPELAAGTAPDEVWTRWGLNPHALAPTEAVLDFYRTVLDELVEVFDSPVVCLGGDEVPLDAWAADPAALARVGELGLEDVDELLPWFVGRLTEHLRGHGRRVSVWDEVGGARVPRDVVVNSWRGVRSGLDALRDGHDVVVCTEHRLYLDHRAAPGLDEPVPVGTVHTLEDVHAFEPVSPAAAETMAEDGAGRVLGAQAQVWTEQLDSPRRVDYATWPRLCAFAEVVWTPREMRERAGFADLERRLTGAHLARLDAAGVGYRPLEGPRPWQRRPGVPGWALRFDDLGQLVHTPTGER
ncbi:beta-N-acetylhexosaminidase [Cellulomonas shaoxiangyii]|uniref:beta-N-acetylhexosaminidase n=1 Tax=Cellulomonas shaoxiangyii TaxID=2566013 RepID=A0A4P7SMS3_9CELL|nr:beta-N-acetylhexosaminidase [Cellulomonas shaoxiangyii]QCB95098.1 beta-N-acetylhexosaminidase [Cellulomonas shaoxiangyii]TGY86303.1 beta-N-acetylhexosaminidase [Cellulomonas shaoxiangyii]